MLQHIKNFTNSISNIWNCLTQLENHINIIGIITTIILILFITALFHKFIIAPICKKYTWVYKIYYFLTKNILYFAILITTMILAVEISNLMTNKHQGFIKSLTDIKPLGYMLGGILAMLGLYVSHRRLLALENQVTNAEKQHEKTLKENKFQNAVELLSSKTVTSRLLGTHSLVQLTLNNDELRFIEYNIEVLILHLHHVYDIDIEEVKEDIFNADYSATDNQDNILGEYPGTSKEIKLTLQHITNLINKNESNTSYNINIPFKNISLNYKLNNILFEQKLIKVIFEKELTNVTFEKELNNITFEEKLTNVTFKDNLYNTKFKPKVLNDLIDTALQSFMKKRKINIKTHDTFINIGNNDNLIEVEKNIVVFKIMCNITVRNIRNPYSQNYHYDLKQNIIEKSEENALYSDIKNYRDIRKDKTRKNILNLDFKDELFMFGAMLAGDLLSTIFKDNNTKSKNSSTTSKTSTPNYWKVSIKHIFEVRKELLNKNYITIGWGNEFKNIDPSIDEIKDVYSHYGRGEKANINNFIKIKKGDIIIIPHPYERKIQVCQVIETAKGINLIFPDEYNNGEIGLTLKVKNLTNNKWIPRDEIDDNPLNWNSGIRTVSNIDKQSDKINTWISNKQNTQQP